ncbi:MAG: hypothetical protein JW891_02175 [Candidatus Lokiarchaeota archaeon]|nr:hypothetical protein [Candidatus Lokiarchaeota archaeon]
MSEKSEIENFANEFMVVEGLKGKAKRMKIMKIVEQVGFDMKKLKTSYLRSTINERIAHH